MPIVPSVFDSTEREMSGFEVADGAASALEEDFLNPSRVMCSSKYPVFDQPPRCSSEGRALEDRSGDKVMLFVGRRRSNRFQSVERKMP